MNSLSLRIPNFTTIWCDFIEEKKYLYDFYVAIKNSSVRNVLWTRWKKTFVLHDLLILIGKRIFLLQKANYYNSYICKNLPKYVSKYCNLAVSTSFRIFLSESSEAAALLPIFPLFDSEQIPGNMMGAAARRPKSSATTTNTTTTIPSSPWPRLFRGRDGTAQQPAAYCVCGLLSPFLFFAHWIKCDHKCDVDVI